MKCYTCRNKGLFAYHRPVINLDKKIRMVFVAQKCYCETGQALFVNFTLSQDWDLGYGEKLDLKEYKKARSAS